MLEGFEHGATVAACGTSGSRDRRALAHEAEGVEKLGGAGATEGHSARMFNWLMHS